MVNPTTPPVPTAISGLANIPSTPSGSDFVPVSRGGITYKATAAQFGTVGPTGPAGPTGPSGTVVPWAIAGGTADAITATYSPPNGSLTDGLLLSFRASAANATTTPTFAPDGLAAHVITDDGGSALTANAIPAALAECLVRYNLAHTRWELLNPAGGGVAITGTPSSGNLAKFSGSNSITNGDLSGDISTSGTLATTLATVNSTTGSFTAANITVNAKGLITAASNSGFVSGNLTLLSAQTITSSTASVSVTTGINSTYSHYIWEISNLTSVTNNVQSFVTVQQGGSFVGGINYYSGQVKTSGSSVVAFEDNGDSSFNMGNTNITTSFPSLIRFEFWNPAIALQLATIFEIFPNGGTSTTYARGGGTVNTNAATTGIKLALSSGNIATCQANLYGVT